MKIGDAWYRITSGALQHGSIKNVCPVGSLTRLNSCSANGCVNGAPGHKNNVFRPRCKILLPGAPIDESMHLTAPMSHTCRSVRRLEICVKKWLVFLPVSQSLLSSLFSKESPLCAGKWYHLEEKILLYRLLFVFGRFSTQTATREASQAEPL